MTGVERRPKVKLRTRITAWLYIAMQISGFLAWYHLPASWQMGADRDVNSTFAGIALAVSAGIILCWVYTISGKAWAWWLTLTVLGLCALAVLPSYFSLSFGVVWAGFIMLGGLLIWLMTCGPNELTFQTLILATCILPLAILLSDPPHKRREELPTAVETLRCDGNDQCPPS
jgi:hypothetical protein